MSGHPRILAVIPARGGSKGLPGKNIRLLAGKPLIAWTIEAAARSRRLTRTVISTDDPGIAEVARKWDGDVPFLRPAEIATDTASSEDVLFHALDASGEDFDWVCLLQPTSPLRTGLDIDGCIDACLEAEADCAFSVCVPPKSPYIMFWLDGGGRMAPLLPQPPSLRRQDLPAVYVPNGAIYVARVGWLRQSRRLVAGGAVGFVMPESRSVDIDYDTDFMIAEARLAQMAGCGGTEDTAR